MGNLFTKQKHFNSLPDVTVISQKNQQYIDKIKNLSTPCCGKADIRFNSTHRLIECTNCQRHWA